MTTPMYRCDCCNGYGEFKYDLNKKIDCAGCKGEGWVTLDKLTVRQEPETTAEYMSDEVTGYYKMAGVTKADGMRRSIPFKIGDVFTTIGGREVECIQLSETRGYETARFSDGGWRYNRPYDRGRATGSRSDSPWNIIPAFGCDCCIDIREAEAALGYLDPGLPENQ